MSFKISFFLSNHSQGPKKDRSNVISCETIAFHTITNIILWSFAALVIGSTPGTLYGVNQDGQTQGKGN